MTATALDTALPNLAFVRTFVTLVEAGSFSAAAERLGLAQPTVSQQIQKLEQTLGLMLIERSHAHCTPTTDGLRVLGPARAVLAAAARLKAAADPDHLTIGASGNVAAYFIAGDLKRFVDEVAPGLDWRLVTATNPEIAERLKAGELDVALMEWPDPDPALDVRAWRREELSVVVDATHPWARRQCISIDELLSLPLIGGEAGSGTGTLLTEALGSRAQALSISRNLHSTEAVKSAVAAGLGSSIVFTRAVADEVAAGTLAAFDVDGLTLEKTLYVALRHGLSEETLGGRLAAFLAGGPEKRAA